MEFEANQSFSNPSKLLISLCLSF